LFAFHVDIQSASDAATELTNLTYEPAGEGLSAGSAVHCR
jgi:hypothetical protein